MAKVNAVLRGNTHVYDIDMGAQRVAAVHHSARQLEKPSQLENDIPVLKEYEVTSGSGTIDQFECVTSVLCLHLSSRVARECQTWQVS